MSRTTIPKITWGASFANTLTIAYLLDNVTSYSEPRDGSAWDRAPSGVEDAWIVGTDYLVSGDVRWIPATDSLSPAATGWDGSTGWRAALEWMRQKNVLRFYPDASSGTYVECYLVEPMGGAPTVEMNGTRTIRLTIRATSGAFDGY